MSSGGRQIERIPPAHRALLDELLPRCTHLPLSHVPGLDPKVLAAMHAEVVGEKAAHDDIVLLGAVAGRGLDGIALLEPLPWDSGLYGRAMGRVSACYIAGDAPGDTAPLLLAAAIREARTRQWRYLDFQPHALQLDAANAAFDLGFRLVSTTVSLLWDLRKPLPAAPATPATLRLATVEDAGAVGEAASRAVDYYSRFCTDPGLESALAPEIFRAWASNSVKGYADRVCVAEMGEGIIGYCTWKRHKAAESQLGLKFANLDLTAVVPEARGQHVLSAMMHEGLAALQQAGFAFAEVVTHALNGPMQRAAHQFGARTLAARHSLHWHA